jgi:hydrogenase maturation protein HypF
LPVTKITTAQQLSISGQVQGVGFRPFVYRLAHSLGIHGWVQNLKGDVLVHIEGEPRALEEFTLALVQQAPSIAKPVIIDNKNVASESPQYFEIRDSDASTQARIHTPTDYFTCPECLGELNDPDNRRYQYPFINCTQCGPRFTLIKKLPYDRVNTTMAIFPLCKACEREYNNPLDRRFHAEPIACAECGPQLQYVDNEQTIDNTRLALDKTVAALQAGQIIAVKGVGGYHLLCDAANDQAVIKLRTRKPRPDKPLAVMFPASGDDELDLIRQFASISETEATLIREPSRPIVVVDSKEPLKLSRHIAPGLNQLGVFLPYSPLHHLLLQAFGRAVVATSANVSGEPVLTEQQQVQQRLSHITDACLHHNRPIARPADDSVIRIIAGVARPLRIGRGLAPLELTLPAAIGKPTLAVGGHMKNTVALAWDKRMVISPHIGDLDSPHSLKVFEQAIHDLQRLYDIKVEQIACDAHRGYASHRWANQTGLPVIPVFHHHAHAATLELEYPHSTPWLVFTWDGVGYGPDDALWGGEALLGRPGSWQRVASFKPFRVPAGDRAARQPWRSAAALCWQAGLDYTAPQEHELVRHAWEKDINCATTSAVGRLFDAAAALTGLLDEASFEGQGPMLAEANTSELQPKAALPITDNDNVQQADWSPLLTVLQDNNLTITQRCNHFHATLAATLVEQAILSRQRHGTFQVGLSGGVFQNKRLTEHVIDLLEQKGFKVFMNRLIPCNDGGLCAGQIMQAIQHE